MKIKFTIQLACQRGGKNFYIATDKTKHAIENDCEITVDIERDYRGQTQLSMFSVEGMVHAQQQNIHIKSIQRNGFPFKDWHKFYQYAVKEQGRDGILCRDRAISRDGTLLLDILSHERIFEFFPYYRSRTREDYVFYNHHFDVPDHYAWGSSPFIHTYRNYPYLPQYRNRRQYHIGCFGCSVTRGVELNRGEEWPALLAKHHSVINLAERGLGADGIFLNLRSCLREFSLDKVVVLWPGLDRQCLRWQVDGWHMRMPISINSTDRLSDRELLQWIWITADQASYMKSRFIERCVSGHQARLSKRIIIKTIKELSSKGITALHSSWSTETYDFLKTLELGPSLLHFFSGDTTGDFYDPAHQHPPAAVHRQWIEQNIKSITN